jgi:hypothetical protein
MITRMLLASVLAIGAGSFAGCGDDTADCPASVGQGVACSTTLTCFSGAMTCACKSGAWDCNTPGPRDLAVPDLSMHDMTPSAD